MLDCKNVNRIEDKIDSENHDFIILAILTRWYSVCLEEIQSKEHYEFPKEQEEIFFNKVKARVKKLKAKLIQLSIKDLKDVEVSLLDYKIGGDINFNKFLVKSLLSSYKAISEKISSTTVLKNIDLLFEWKGIIENLKKLQLDLGSGNKFKVNEYLKVRRDANSLYKIYSTIDSFVRDLKENTFSEGEKRLALQTVFHIIGEYLKDTQDTANLSPDVKKSLKGKGIPVELLSKFRDMLTHNQVLPLIEADDGKITKLFKKCFLPIQEVIKNKIIEIESNFVKDIVKRSKSQVEDKSVIEKLVESKREQGIQGLVQSIESIKKQGSYKPRDKELIEEIYQNAKRMRSNDFPEDIGRLPSGTDTYKKEPEDAIKQYIYESKSKVYDKLYDELHFNELKNICDFKNAHDDAVEVTKVIDYLRYKSPFLSHDIFDNFLNMQVFAKIPMKVHGHDTTLKKQLQKYFDAESFKKRLLYRESQDDKKKLTELLKGIPENSESKRSSISFFHGSKSSHIAPDEYERLIRSLGVRDKNKEEKLLLYSVEWRKKKCIELLEAYPLALKMIYDDILEGKSVEGWIYGNLIDQYQLVNEGIDSMKEKAFLLKEGMEGKVKQLYLNRVKEEVEVLRGVEHPYAVKAQIINVYSLLEIATGKADGIGGFQLRKLRNYLAHGDVLTSDQDDKFLAKKLVELKNLIIKRLGNSEITLQEIGNLIDSLQLKVNKGEINEAGKIIGDISKMLCPKVYKRGIDVEMLCTDPHSKESPEEKERKEERIKELFNTDEMRKIIENAEFYNQLSKIAKQISAGEAIDRNIEKAFIVKVRNMNLDLIDPEIRDIVKEIEKNINGREINKEEIRTIFTRYGVADNIEKVAEKANLALATFFVGKHIVNGDIEGLGYDALNLWVIPKISEKISRKMLELGGKLDSQMLRGFAPIAGRAIGNLFAFIGLEESIKARINAKDPIDKKIADLNIATNSIFIAADMPAVATEVVAAVGMEVGVVGEFAGPVGAAIAVAVVIIGQFVEAKLEVAKLAEQVEFIDQEEHDLRWNFFLGMKMPEYIERDIEAKKIYENYISNITDKFKSNFDTIAISLPKITLEEREYAKVKEPLGVVPIDAPSKECIISKEKSNIKLDFSLDTIMGLSKTDYAKSYSRVIPKKIQSYDVLCGPTDENIQVGVLQREEEYLNYSMLESCRYRYGDNHKILSREWQEWSLDAYPLSCNNAVVYSNKGSNNGETLYYMMSQNAKIYLYKNNNITVAFHGEEISVLSFEQNVDIVNGTKLLSYFSERGGDVDIKTKSKVDAFFSLSYQDKDVYLAKAADIEIKNELRKIFSLPYQNKDVNNSTENRYYFSQELKNCAVHNPGNNFFYITESKFSCDLRGEGQKNIVVMQDHYFTDSNNKMIQAIIGSNGTNHIAAFYASYIDGKGGNDTIVANNSTVIKGYFGDNIHGKGLVLLPMVFSDINKMTLVNNTKTIYSKGGNLTIHGKEMLMKTRDDFFVTPTKIDNRTKMVTDLHVVNYNKTEVSEAFKVCPDNEVPMVLDMEELYLKKSFEDAGFHFIRRLFGNKYMHKDASGCIFMDSTPVIITSALQGKLISNPNFNVTKQVFNDELDVVIGDSDHHIFYADKRSHFFYWEGGKNVLNYYLFGSKNVTAIINKANGLLDFSELEGRNSKYEVEDDAVFIGKDSVTAVLPLNYKNVTVTLDGRKYYKLLQDGELERDYCSHNLKVDGRFSINSTELLNYYNCFMFDSSKVLFSKLNNDLLLLSDKGALSMLEYYSFVHRDWDLSIRLNDEIIEPEEFKERADNPSSFRHYPINNEQDLTIYHNQPIDKHKIGLIDLKDESILDCNMKIADGNLVLSFKDRPTIRIKNWSVYPSVREIMFAFNDTKIFNMKCIVSNCNPEEIIEEFRKEKIKFSKKNSAADNLIWDILFQEEKEGSAQRHKRHLIRHEGHPRGHRNRRNIKNDNFAIESNKATSGASKQFSWVNAFANTVVSAARGIISFLFKPAIGTEYFQPSKTVITQGIDISSTLFLLDVLIRKITDQKYIATVGQPTSLLEVRGYAVEITTEFEKILENTAKRSGISAEKLSFDIPGVQKAIEVKIINGELSKIPVVLCSAIGEAYQKNEKFLSILKGNIEKVLSRQQIVNNGNKEQDMAVNKKVPSSLFNSIIIEPASDKGLREVM